MKRTFLKNDRIHLRAVEPEDLEVMYEMENDPAMWDVSSFTVPYSRFVLRQYIEGSQCDVFADKQLRMMIIRNDDNRTLGTIDVTDFVPLHSHGAVGIAIHRLFRNEGYAADALRLLCDYVFEFLCIRQLYAYVAVDNEASLHLFRACGFVQSGVLKEWLQTADGFRDAVLMQCLNPKK